MTCVNAWWMKTEFVDALNRLKDASRLLALVCLQSDLYKDPAVREAVDEILCLTKEAEK